MKKILISLTLVIFCIATYAQQMVYMSQNMFSQLMYNPAYAGMSQGYNADLAYRAQSGNFPSTSPAFLFNGDATLPCINTGIGITAFRDADNIASINEIKLSYSYHVYLGSGKLSGGASFGYFETFIKNNWEQPLGVYPIFPNNSSTYDLGFGLYYSNQNGMYVGLSTSKLAGGDLMNHSSMDPGYDYPQQYYFTGGYDFKINSDCDLLPNIYISSNKDYTVYQPELTLQGKFFWMGIGYGIDKSVGMPNTSANNNFIAMIGFLHTFQNGSAIKLGYSYNFPSTDSFNNDIHEIHLAFCIKQSTKETVKS